MSYLVLARKYRPQTFEQIVGQEHVTRTLTNAIAQGRLHHAFLFTGARGVGKTTAARILAKALSCAHAPTATPCNQCDACREITSGSSVDVQEIDAASNNGVDNIRELREAIRYAPVRGKKKVYILDEVHMLSSGAWNALLKTLEEPPPHAIFIFATTDPHKLPATILSRVQRYDFKLVPSRRIVEHLASVLDSEAIPYAPGALQLIARESGGSVRDSLSLLDQVIASLEATLTEEAAAEVLGVADRALVTELGRAVLRHDPGAALQLVDAAFARGYDLAQLAQTFLAHLRDLVVISTVDQPGSLVELSPSEIEASKLELRTLSAPLIELYFDRFSRVAEEIARSSVPRYALEVGLIQLTRIEPLQPLAELMAKLEALEARLERLPRSTAATSGPSVPPSPTPGAPRATETPGAPRPSAPPKGEEKRKQNTAPTAEVPAPVASLRPASPPQKFTDLVEAVLAIEPRLSALAQGRLVTWSGDRLSIGFDKEFAAEGVRERREQLQAALKKVTGRELTVEIVVGELPKATESETLLEVEQRKLDEDRERRRQEALTHPMRKIIDEQFGGAWKEPVVDLENNKP